MFIQKILVNKYYKNISRLYKYKIVNILYSLVNILYNIVFIQ